MKLLVFLLLPCLSLGKVSPGFGNCTEFFLNKDPPEFTPQWGTTVEKICQCVRHDKKKITYHYATLYNTDWKIPIYSAYVFHGYASVARVDRWYIEPQLDGHTEECMAPKQLKTINNQAVKSDYEVSYMLGNEEICYDKGHLYPVQHTHDEFSMLATSTLTNAAPQNSCFNQRKWNQHEKVVIKDLESCSNAYVVTGVVPDLTKPKLNNKVPVSMYYWRATCCLKNSVYTGKGYFGPDNNNKVKQLSIKDLQNQLAKDYNVTKVVIFPSLPTPPGSKRPLVNVGCV
ncbi:endonuclease domain-containing 1 protein-like [Pimephales promelas]|uniref:endonuclease domain-containing 1 protein-like n=1 Tax=Pimephales promelas TaxID=90988 RepID=UPI0019559090|nr:endonuclease domain-containing 1 protein-like [Pimephales promelas]